MAPLYIKALHIIFIVTWFAGLFYIVRLFIYQAEANEKTEPERTILLQQFGIMTKRLWFGITSPSALLTLILGPTTWYMTYGGFNNPGSWLMIKLCFVAGLYAYHWSLHVLFKQQSKGIFKYTSGHLRMWNEVATLFLVAIVMLAVVKQGMSFVWALGSFALLIVALMLAIKIYKGLRGKGKG